MMKSKWIILAMVLIIPAMLFTVSCAKQTVSSEPKAEKKQAPAKKTTSTKLKSEASDRDLEMAKNRFLNENVYFDFDDATLNARAQDLLQQKAAWMRDNPNANVIIEGHCDERGTNAYNLALGDRRAASTKKFMEDLGISGKRMTTISYGEEKPVDAGKYEEAWAKNRRAAFGLD